MLDDDGHGGGSSDDTLADIDAGQREVAGTSVR
jgi:hypothetical protein